MDVLTKEEQEILDRLLEKDSIRSWYYENIIEIEDLMLEPEDTEECEYCNGTGYCGIWICRDCGGWE